MLCSFWWLEFGRRRKISGRITWSRYPFPQRMMLSGAGNLWTESSIAGNRREFPWSAENFRRNKMYFFSKAPDDRIDCFEVMLFTMTQNFANIVSCRIADYFQFPKPSSIMRTIFITRYSRSWNLTYYKVVIVRIRLMHKWELWCISCGFYIDFVPALAPV